VEGEGRGVEGPGPQYFGLEPPVASPPLKPMANIHVGTRRDFPRRICQCVNYCCIYETVAGRA